MRRRNWKSFRANSRREAVEACIRHAREMHNASVERVAEEAGLEGHWRIYKWMESGDVPLRLVIPFQKACGCTFITDYMAYTTHKLVISMPSGRHADSRSIFKLQAHLNATVGYMLQYDEQHADQLAEKAINAIKTAMEDLAYHQINIEKQRQPELELFGEPS